MEYVQQILEDRREKLCKLAEETRNRLKKAPEGKLRVKCRQGNTYYFRKSDKSEANGKYIPAKDKQLAVLLAQKDYDERFLKSAEKEIRAINSFLKGVPTTRVEELYERMDKGKKELIIPAVETDEMFAERWVNEPYSKKKIADNIPLYLTDRGERVRSKSEMIIANTLAQEGIPYHYEQSLWLETFGEVYLDFTLLNVRLRKIYYWEHQGMMDDAGYANKAVQKQLTYHENGIFEGDRLILTSETATKPINSMQVRNIIHHYLI